MKYFAGSYIFTILGLICAYLWGEHIKAGSGLLCVFIALILGILEVSLSFDNAVVNAMKLEKMSKVWQRRFITWGIAIAVFGMRFLFPLLVVSIFAKLGLYEVLKIAIFDSGRYKLYLHQTHASIVTFGGAFLLMLFMGYFMNPEKKIDWIPKIEKWMKIIPSYRTYSVILAVMMVDFVHIFQPLPIKLNVLISGLSGILTYLIIESVSKLLENMEEKKISQDVSAVKNAGYTGLVSFLYLELIDASFSLDGVLGAFALSSDIIIITIGLAIGAMFVRSLTIMLVEKKTLNDYIYLEHGAHWAIGVLAIIMFVSTVIPVSEIITGLSGLVLIVLSLISSVKENKRRCK